MKKTIILLLCTITLSIVPISESMAFASTKETKVLNEYDYNIDNFSIKKYYCGGYHELEQPSELQITTRRAKDNYDINGNRMLDYTKNSNINSIANKIICNTDGTSNPIFKKCYYSVDNKNLITELTNVCNGKSSDLGDKKTIVNMILNNIYSRADSLAYTAHTPGWNTTVVTLRKYLGMTGDNSWRKGMVDSYNNSIEDTLKNYGIYSKVYQDKQLINMNDLLSIDSQKKLYKKNLNKLFEYIDKQIDNNTINGWSYVIKSSINSPLTVCNLSDIEENHNQEGTANFLFGLKKTEADLYLSIGDSYGSIIAYLAPSGDNKYDITIGYYLDDYYDFADESVAYNNITQGEMKLLHDSGYIYTAGEDTGYGEVGEKYKAENYKMFGAYQEDIKYSKGFRYTIND